MWKFNVFPLLHLSEHVQVNCYSEQAPGVLLAQPVVTVLEMDTLVELGA